MVRTAAPSRASGRWRWLRLLALIAAVLTVMALGATYGMVALLDSGVAREQLRVRLERQLAAGQPIRVSLGSARVTGLSGIVLRDLAVEPLSGGHRIAHIDEVIVTTGLISAVYLPGTRLDRVRVIRPRVWVVEDRSGGTNVSALAGGNRASTPSSSLTIDRLLVEDGEVVWRPWREPEVVLRDLGLAASLGISRHGALTFELLRLRARLSGQDEPREISLHVNVRTSDRGDGGVVVDHLIGRAGGSRITAGGELGAATPGKERPVHVRIDELVLDPAAVHAELPALSPRGTLSLTGRLDGTLAALHLTGRLRWPHGHAVIRGTGALLPRPRARIEADCTHLVVDDIVGRGPVRPLDLTLLAEGAQEESRVVIRRVEVRHGESVAELSGFLSGSRGAIKLARVVLTPADLHAWWDELSPGEALRGDGDVTFSGARAELRLAIGLPAAGQVALSGSIDGALSEGRFQVRLERVRPAQLVPVVPASARIDAAFRLHGSLGGEPRIDLQTERVSGSVEEIPLTNVSARAALHGTALQLDQLSANIPGAALDAMGHAYDDGTLWLALDLRITDSGRLPKAAAWKKAMAGIDQALVTGAVVHGELQRKASGPGQLRLVVELPLGAKLQRRAHGILKELPTEVQRQF